MVFPLSICNEFETTSDMYNHASALAYKNEVSAYIKDEVKANAMLGPFSTLPFDKFHVSPLLSRPKPGNKRRIIVDLSWPRDNSLNANVTEMYDDLHYKLKYPTLDIIRNRLIQLGPTALLFKIDLSRAFRNLPVDPIDVHLLGISFNDNYYIDLSIPFGYVHGSACCQRVTDAIRYICNKKGFWIFNYCDDLIGIELPHKATKAFEFTYKLISDLGFPINMDKLIKPSPCITCIGIQVSAIDMKFSIPQDKLQEIAKLCDIWASKKWAKLKKFQSLLGKLVYVCKCIRYARIFLGRMLQLLRSNYGKQVFKLTVDFSRDIAWFKKFMFSFNGNVLISPNVQFEIYLDASFAGFGAICHNMPY